MPGPKKGSKRLGWGSKRKLPSGRWQASYPDPEGRVAPNGREVRHSAPNTFDTELDALAWLHQERRLIDLGVWKSPAERAREAAEAAATPALTVRTYAERWVATRDLRAASVRSYRSYLDNHILPALGDVPLGEVTVSDVFAWESALRQRLAKAGKEKHAALLARDAKKAATAAKTGRPWAPPVRRLNDGTRVTNESYNLLRNIYSQAVAESLVLSNPCQIKRRKAVGKANRQGIALERDELTALADAIAPELRAWVLLSGLGSPRIGESLGLRTSDLELHPADEHGPARGTVRIERQTQNQPGVDPRATAAPKTDAARRTVNLPSEVVEALLHHVEHYAGKGPGALLFPSPRDPTRPWPETTLRAGRFKAAAAAIGRPELVPHDLRTTAATHAARAGATAAELMARIGHTTYDAALRYQRASEIRDAEIAERLDEHSRQIPSLAVRRQRRA